jgi:hypothetical protein
MQTFSNVTTDVWNCLRQKAHGAGIEINANSGQASKLGVTIAWNYDPVAHTLQLQALSHGILFGCTQINNKMHEIVDGCHVAHGQTMGAILGH